MSASAVWACAFLKKPEGKGYAQVGSTVRLEGGAGGVGIVLRKGDDGLRDKVNAALKARPLPPGRHRLAVHRHPAAGPLVKARGLRHPSVCRLGPPLPPPP